MSINQSSDDKVFAYFSFKEDALEYAAKQKNYTHTEVFERITEDGKPISR